MVLWLLRIVLIWWLATVVMRWITGPTGRGQSRRAESSSDHDRDDTGPNEPPDIPVHGQIEDADFEDMGDK